jgi:hypothetical protein
VSPRLLAERVERCLKSYVAGERAAEHHSEDRGVPVSAPVMPPAAPFGSAGA